jgi:hypothetical protein
VPRADNAVPLKNLLERLSEHWVWLNGVIVALTVEKAVEGFLHGFDHSWFVDPTHDFGGLGRHAPAEMEFGWLGHLLQLWRVIVLFVIAARFYLGSVYLAESHLTNNVQERGRSIWKGGWTAKKVAATAYRRRAIIYRRHFFIGISHFALFFAWSLTITIFRYHWGFSSYFIVLEVILLWDLWYLGSPRGFSHPWVELNFKIALGGFCLWGVAALLVGGECKLEIADAVALAPAVWVSAREMGWIFKNAFKDYDSGEQAWRELDGI